MTPTEQYNRELYHYGVKGMKWGVRKKYISEGRVERAAKKLANYKAKEASALNRFTNDITAAVITNSLDNRRMKRRLNTSKRQLIKAKNRAEKQFNKMKKDFANTPYSDIKVSAHTANGKTYINALIARVGTSPYDGSDRYKVTAGTWAK